MAGARPSGSFGGSERLWRNAFGATLVATWALMVLGALTRASMAGVACPDWPLCHGYLVPPLEASAYPQDSNYLVYKVYLEFLHRALAAGVSVGALLLGLKVWSAGGRAVAIALWGVLGLQVALGAVTVWTRNAPFTVVLHLGLALAFLGLLLVARRRLFGAGPRPASPARRGGWALLLGLVTGQMLVGATVSARYYGLACDRFPLCDAARLWPEVWNAPLAWQIAHRGLGALALAGAVALAASAWRRGTQAAADRALLAGCVAGLIAQVLLGGLNVWLRVPPWASAAHLGLAVVLFGLIAQRVLAPLGLRAASRDV